MAISFYQFVVSRCVSFNIIELSLRSHYLATTTWVKSSSEMSFDVESFLWREMVLVKPLPGINVPVWVNGLSHQQLYSFSAMGSYSPAIRKPQVSWMPLACPVRPTGTGRYRWTGAAQGGSGTFPRCSANRTPCTSLWKWPASGGCVADHCGLRVQLQLDVADFARCPLYFPVILVMLLCLLRVALCGVELRHLDLGCQFLNVSIDNKETSSWLRWFWKAG